VWFFLIIIEEIYFLFYIEDTFFKYNAFNFLLKYYFMSKVKYLLNTSLINKNKRRLRNAACRYRHSNCYQLIKKKKNKKKKL